MGYNLADQGQVSPPVPQGLNPRLLNVRGMLYDAEKMLAELTHRLGIVEPPATNTKASEAAQPSVASVTMDLTAAAGRLQDRVRVLLNEVG